MLTKSLLIISFFLFLLFAMPVSAQKASLSLSPSKTEVLVKPGKSVNLDYELINHGDPIILSIKLLAFEPQGNLGNIKLKSELKKGISFNITNSNVQLDQAFLLKSNEKKDLNLQIIIPNGTELQDYYYTLLIETQPSPAKENDFVLQTKARIGSHIILTVSDVKDIETKGLITLFEIIPSFKLEILGKKINIFDSGDKIPVILIAENKGRNLLKPSGFINLQGAGKKIKYTIVTDNILAYSQRQLNAVPSLETNQRPYSLLLNGLFIGRYNLSTQLYLGKNSEASYPSISFIVLPIKIIFFLLISIALCIIFREQIYICYKRICKKFPI